MTDIQRRKLSDSDITKLASLNAADLLYIERSNEAYALPGSVMTDLVDATQAAVESVPATFATVAAAVASTTIVIGEYIRTLGYYSAGDGGHATYKVVAAGTGTADGGSYINLTGISGQLQLMDKAPVHPKVFGAYGTGIVDDTTAIKAWVAFTNSSYNNPGFSSGVPRMVFDLRGYIYGVTEKIQIPSSGTGARSIILCNGSFVALSGGNGFNNGSYNAYGGDLAEGYTGWVDPVIELNSAYCIVSKVNVFCQDIANGIVCDQGRVNVHGSLIRRQKNVGFWQQESGGDLRFSQCLIQQFNGTNDDLSDESVFTAIDVLIENSDCKISNSTFSWALKGVVITSGGITQMTDCHIFGGTTPPRTNSTLIEYQGTGALVCNGVYLDNGQVHLYRDRCTFRDCVYLTDSADVDQTAMFYLHCRDADQDGTFPQISISGGHFSEYNGADEFIELVNGPSYSWAAGAQTWIDLLNDAVVAGKGQESEMEVKRQMFTAVNANGGDFVQNYRSTFSKCMIAFDDTAKTTASMGIGSAGNTLWARFSAGANFIVARLIGTPLLQVDETDGVTASALKVTNGRATLDGNLVGGNQVTISDDAVASLTPPRTGGWMLLTASGGGASPEATQSAMIWFDTGTTLAIEKAPAWSSVGTNVDVSTSDVTGTTGTDTKTTVAVQSGVVKIENRTGSARNYQVTWL